MLTQILPAEMLEQMTNPNSGSHIHGLTDSGQVITQQLPDEPMVWKEHQSMRRALSTVGGVPMEAITATVIDMHLQPDPEKRGEFVEHQISIRAQDPVTLASITQQVWDQVATDKYVMIEALLEGKGDFIAQLGDRDVYGDLNVPLTELLDIN